jgi:copper chaperone NosL
MQARSKALRASTLMLLWLLAACARGPRPIAYGSDVCGYCRMVISDQRYGAEVVTTKGKVHTFDSIECLASYYLQRRRAGAADSAWVTDFERPGTLVPAAAAHYLRAAGPSSPMGKGLMAFAPAADTAALRRTFGGEPMGWADVLALVEREGLTASSPAGATAAGNVH